MPNVLGFLIKWYKIKVHLKLFGLLLHVNKVPFYTVIYGKRFCIRFSIWHIIVGF